MTDTMATSRSPATWLAAFLAALLAAGLAPAARAAPDLVLYNARVFTASKARPYAQAIAIEGQRIVAVGSSKQMTALAGSGTRLRDLHGQLVIPGIDDAHYHLFVQPAGTQLKFKDDEPTWPEVQAALAEAAARDPKGAYIFADLGAAIFEDRRATRQALDAIAPDHKVVLRNPGGHFYVLNSEAMRSLGVAEDEPDPKGGIFEHTAPGGPLNGRAIEFAAFALHRRIANLTSDQDALQQTREFLQQAVQFGITSVQNMSIPVPATRLVDLYSAAPTPIRQRIMHYRLTDSRGPIVGESDGQRPGLPPLITVSGIKWVLDGTPIERTAALRAPYTDDPQTAGWMNFSQADMQSMLQESLARKQQMVMHIIGDRTTEAFLDAMDATGGARQWSGRRVRIEHGCGLAPDLLARAHALGVLVIVDPLHLDFGFALEKRWGPERTQQFEPMQSLLKAGIPLALGSDGLLNPYANIMYAVMHPMRPGEGLTREQAVIAYTRTSAYAEFAERDKGSLEPGKLADLAVLSQDIFTVPLDQLPVTESVLTMVGGTVVYEKAGAKP